MILYFDAGALLDRYLRERSQSPPAASLRAWSSKVEASATSRSSLLEATSELVERPPWGRLPRRRLQAAFEALVADWDDYVVVDGDVRRAADLAWKHRLKGQGALHVTCAETVVALAWPNPLAFVSLDRAVSAVARREGLQTVDPDGWTVREDD